MRGNAVGCWLTAAVSLAGAGIIAVHPVGLPQAGAGAIGLAATAADITVDFVRHGESADNAEGILGTVAPGAPLTAVGVRQAHAFLRAQETARTSRRRSPTPSPARPRGR